MCYTDPNIFSSGYWLRFWDAPILGPCSSNSSQPISSSIPTKTPFHPTITTTPTICPVVVIPSPTSTLEPVNWEDLGVWSISHYVTALEDDPYFQNHGPYMHKPEHVAQLNRSMPHTLTGACRTPKPV